MQTMKLNSDIVCIFEKSYEPKKIKKRFFFHSCHSWWYKLKMQWEKFVIKSAKVCIILSLRPGMYIGTLIFNILHLVCPSLKLLATDLHRWQINSNVSKNNWVQRPCQPCMWPPFPLMSCFPLSNSSGWSQFCLGSRNFPTVWFVPLWTPLMLTRWNIPKTGGTRLGDSPGVSILHGGMFHQGT